jgi:hypothetical protein
VVPDWPNRLRINSGLERVGAGWLPREDWRPLTAAELSFLLAEDSRPRSLSLLSSHEDEIPVVAETFDLRNLNLLSIPHHLLARWWALMEQREDPSGGVDIASFLRHLLEFCTFKQVPVPESCAGAVLVTGPGQRSLRSEGSGQEPVPGNWRALVNLGDEASAFLFQNVHPGTSLSGHPWVEEHADRPVFRCTLAPREGAWVPQRGCPVDGTTVSRNDLDILLVLLGD